MTDRDAEQNRDARDAPSASVAITAGAALFNERQFLAARDVWRGERRPPGGAESDGDGKSNRDESDSTESDGDGERLRRGLAATAAATHRAIDGDRSGAAARADDAVAALASVSDPRGVALGPVREWADRLATPPENADSASVPRVRIDGETPAFGGLSLAAAGVAARALAGAGEPGDPEVLATAADLASEERGTGRTEFAELLFAYLRTPDARPQVAARLGDHVEREERKRRDVDGLF
ncbi:hypothetical protein SAMN04488067_1133 [Halorubrum xinjiangense]|uniref:DUF309 domain-containing protein n=1 Tax=Halorubrum xinjiangense TaxID=261291 RepID=A0A1G7QVI3_9EURY|nr:hypothetical protein [Halorubrum xinjiangense]SDG02464.1 hypothetical protein SAMN04488067_1133 [Halorubrum xinjiangense]